MINYILDTTYYYMYILDPAVLMNFENHHVINMPLHISLHSGTRRM